MRTLLFPLIFITFRILAQDIEFKESFDSINSDNSNEFFWGKKYGDPLKRWGMEVNDQNRVRFLSDSSNKFIAITVHQNDRPGKLKPPRTRSEIKYIYSNHITQGTWYYSWKMMIPADSQFIEEEPPRTKGLDPYHYIVQWHDPIPKNAIDKDTFNTEVPFFIEYLHDTTSISLQRNIRLKFKSTRSKTGFQIMEASITKGKWFEVKLKIKWSSEADGFIEAWIDDVQFYTLSGNTLMKGANLKRLKNGKIGNNYFKVGHYRNLHNKSQTIYFDDFQYWKDSF